MQRLKNIILRRGISILLITALIISGLFLYPKTAAAMTVEKTVTKYHLDIGAQQIWGSKDSKGNMVWQNGIGKGGVMRASASLEFPGEVKNVKAYPYSSSEFKWGEAGYSFNSNGYLKNEKDFINKYKDFSSSSIYNVRASSSGNRVHLSYSAVMAGVQDFDLKMHLSLGDLPMILELMGGEEVVKSNQSEVYKYLVDGDKNGLGVNDYGFMYFTPVIIQYDVVELVEVGELKAELTLPGSAKQGESYTASDRSYISTELKVREAMLEKSYDGGNWQTVTIWKGTGAKGENTGGNTEETCSDICSITYRLTVTAESVENPANTQSGTDIKTINIVDGRAVEGTAILELPDKTYEGHQTPAVDISEFKIDGFAYSARRAYEEGVAENEFNPRPSGVGNARKTGKTTADIVFTRRGNYEVRLDIDTINGMKLSDTKPIEVLKTPYIIDHLGGIQKQNRRQLLNISVATYPGKPIVDYYIELQDLKTGQTVNLSKERTEENTAFIKTRTHKRSGDQYWTNFELEFLTKTPKYNPKGENQGQEFRYTVYVKDSKGDTDIQQKIFKVKPDMPPNAAIKIQNSFIRNKGTNTAEIIAEDGTTTDGDQVEKTWSCKGNAVENISGFKDLSFGNRQKVKFNKEGVGKTDVELKVKDRWIEPTLEEYITEADYLTGETAADTEVINIAPTVRLEPVKVREIDLAIITDKASKEKVRKELNTLKAAFIEKGYDANVHVVGTEEPDGGSLRSAGSWTHNISVNCPICRGSGLVFDSEYAYRVIPSGQVVDGYQEVCIAPHTIEARRPADDLKGLPQGLVWSYTVVNSNNFQVKVDKQEKYAYIVCYDIGKTIVLNRDTGAEIVTLHAVLGGEIYWGENENIYDVNGSSIQKIDGSTGKVSIVYKGGGTELRLQNGKPTFLGQNSAGYFIGSFNMSNEIVESVAVPKLQEGEWSGGGMSGIEPTDLDSSGKVVFKQMLSTKSSNGSSENTGCYFWIADTKTQKVIRINQENIALSLRGCDVGFVKDERGEAKYVYFSYGDVYYSSQSMKTFYGLKIFDLEGKEKTSYFKKTSISGQEIVYAALNSKENVIYLKQGSSIASENFGGNSYGKGFKIYLPSFGIENFSQETVGFDLFDEYARMNDRFVGTYMSYDMWIGMSARTKLIKRSLTTENAIYLALNSQIGFRDTAEKFVATNNDSEAMEDFLLENNGTKIPFDGISGIAAIAIKIDDFKNAAENVIKLGGDSLDNLASVLKEYSLEPDTEYEYEYHVKINDGVNTDLFYSSEIETLKNKVDEDGKKPLYGNLAAKRNFSSPDTTGFFKEKSSYYLRDMGGLGSGYYGKHYENKSFWCSVEFDMAEDGYVEFDYMRYEGGGRDAGIYLTIDGKQLLKEYAPNAREHLLFNMDKGHHSIVLSGYAGVFGYVGMNNIEVWYLGEENNGFEKANLPDVKNSFITVKNRFKSPKIPIYEKKVIASQAAEKVPTDKLNIVTQDQVEWGIGKNSASFSSGYYKGRAKGYIEAAAGESEILVVSFNESMFSQMDGYPGIGGSGRFIRGSDGKISMIVLPGQRESRSYYCTKSNWSGTMRDGWVSLSDIQVAVLDAKALNIPLGSKFIRSDLIGTGSIGEDLYEFEFNGDNFTLYKLEDKQQGAGTLGNTKIGLSTIGSAKNINAEVKNFSLYKLSNGMRQCVFSEIFNSEKKLQKNGWNFSKSGNAKAEIGKATKAEQIPDPPLIYKKGEPIRYNIFYEDYEKDPSKRQYWKYTHTPFNDGAHPQAAIVLDENGSVFSSGGAILKNSIPKFYIDGKYTVEHWQYDNTARSENPKDKDGFPVGNPHYDKASNIEAITFYVEGGSNAPWITSIKTTPSKVKEGSKYKLQIGVDDQEKDELRLTTELYKENKLIYTHKTPDILADPNGNYPIIITDQVPIAESGNYQVVCTVRDKTGVGIGTYKFYVISDGRITGYVNHTAKWNENRKKYNVKKPVVGDEETPRTKNIFWSGEKFILSAAVAGKPTKVTCQIVGYPAYKTAMESRGRKNSKNETVYEGSLWDKSMINKWGRKKPEPLTFLFTADYSGGIVKTHNVKIIVDSKIDYWQLHRLF